MIMWLVLERLRMRYEKIKMIITDSGSAERKAYVISNLFQKEIIDTHFRSAIEYQKKYGQLRIGRIT